MAGNVWRIQIPPSSWRLMAKLLSRPMTKTSAPNLTTSDAIFDTRASSAGVAPGRRNSR